MDHRALANHHHLTYPVFRNPMTGDSTNPSDLIVPTEPQSASTSPSPRTLEQLLDEVETHLSSPAPTADKPEVGSLRNWLESIYRGENWPAKSPDMSSLSINWATARLLLRDIAVQARELDASAAQSASGAMQTDRIRILLRSLAIYCALAALNSNKSDATDGSSTTQRYELSSHDKHTALIRFIEGWRSANGSRSVPGFVQIALEDPECLTGQISRRACYYDMLDFITSGANAAKTTCPAFIRRFLLPPVIVAQNAWVRFLIRFHRRQATLREGISTALRAGFSKGGNSLRREFWALRGIDFAAYPGDTIGVIGRNGSGKTTLLKSLAGILTPDRGRIAVKGKVGCLLSFGVGFNSQLSGRENIFLNGSILGLSEREIAQRLDQIIAFSELGEFIDAPVRTYSAGMRGRLGFSIAVNIDPDVLILDEVLTVGDDYFQKKAGSILDRFQKANKTVVIASHSMDLIRQVATRAIWIDEGRIRMSGETTPVTRAYVAECRRLRELSRGKSMAAKGSDSNEFDNPGAKDLEDPD
ncbi:MAG: ABC transporter ATP-binding protein [Phycisphaerae bacterium]|nr:ABC transporter ATP-binding protein [Phycisphaerae bacterium]